MKKLLLTACAVLSLTACNIEASAEKEQARATEALTAEANRQIGMPDIINFQERRLAKQILEMRDTEIATHSYIKNDMRGCLVYLGASIGFGLPYAVQFTNPQVSDYHGNGGSHALPQADPNGLYMPDSLTATWVLLFDPNTKKTAPVYVESELTVSPFRLKHIECK